MKVHGFLTRYRYLLRSIISIVCALCIPASVFALVLIDNSARELERRNQAYYQETTQAFRQYFLSQLDDLRTHALSLSFSRASEKPELTMLESLKRPYDYFEAVKILADYKLGLSHVGLVGCFFENTDTVLTSKYKYTLDDFYNLYLYGTPEERDVFQAFMSFTAAGDLHLYTAGGLRGPSSAGLLVGVPVASAGRSRAVIFYELNTSAFSPGMFATPSAQGMQFYIFDTLGVPLYAGAALPQSPEASGSLINFAADPAEGMLQIRNGDGGFTAFKARDTQLGLSFVAVVQPDALNKNLLAFSQVTHKSLIFLVLGLLSMLALTVYINYRPIADLLQGLRRRGLPYADGEIRSIENALVHMEEAVSEQRIQLMDYLLANLLHGIPLPSEDLRRLDSAFGGPLYALTVAGAQLDHTQREALTARLQNDCSARVYILDLLTKDRMVLVCIPANADTAPLSLTVRRFLTGCGQGNAQVGAGHLVPSPDGLYDSYMQSVSCLEAAAPAALPPSPTPGMIEGYPAEDVQLFLSHVRNGETDTALAALERIRAHLLRTVTSRLLMRYLCYGLLTAYVQCLQSAGYTLADWETGELLAHHDLDGLAAALASSVRRVGAFITRRQEESYRSLERRVIEYVNAHFTDPDFTRTQVADHFGISVYSLSRLVKDSLGIGLKEYATARRVELARELLLTTQDPIVAISAAVGFSSPDYFSKVFKGYFGVSPSHVRDHEALV